MRVYAEEHGNPADKAEEGVPRDLMLQEKNVDVPQSQMFTDAVTRMVGGVRIKKGVPRGLPIAAFESKDALV